MSDEPQPEGFTFKDRRRAASEPSEARTEVPSEPSFTVNDRRHAVEPPQAPLAPPPPPPPSAGFGFGAPTAASAAPQAPNFGGFGGGGPSGAGYADEPQLGYGYDDSPDAGEMPTDLPDVRSFFLEMLMPMQQIAVVRLGLMPNPITGQRDVDLDQARMAIDAVTFFADQLEPALPHEERLSLRTLVSELRHHFVQLAQEQGT